MSIFKRYPYQQKYRVKGIDVFLKVNSEVEKYRGDTYESKEPETLQWIDDYMQKEDVFIDIGANIGIYSLYAAKKHNLVVHSFEPDSANFYSLNCNILANSLQDRISACNVALANKCGVDRFSINLDDRPFTGKKKPSLEYKQGLALHSTNNDPKFTYSYLTCCSTLDSLVEKGIVPCPNHIKMDVDGTEDQIYDGLLQILRNKELRTLFIEVDDENKSLIKQVEEQGFISQKYSHSNNVLFVRK